MRDEPVLERRKFIRGYVIETAGGFDVLILTRLEFQMVLLELAHAKAKNVKRSNFMVRFPDCHHGQLFGKIFSTYRGRKFEHAIFSMAVRGLFYQRLLTNDDFLVLFPKQGQYILGKDINRTRCFKKVFVFHRYLGNLQADKNFEPIASRTWTTFDVKKLAPVALFGNVAFIYRILSMSWEQYNEFFAKISELKVSDFRAV